MKVQLNLYKNQSFYGHGARNICQVMNRLHDAAYNDSNPAKPEYDIIEISATMKDGTEVSAIANFEKGRFSGLSFPYEYVQYRNEFCRTIIDKYNKTVTRGKHSR